MTKTIEIEKTMTVGSLADHLTIPVSKLIGELMKNGVMVTVNERIDIDTAQIIIDELGLDVQLIEKETENKIVQHKKNKISDANGTKRPPVVAVMGHVDHGKTSLLDAIRETNVTQKEAGGITQHISAYQIEHNKRLITFLDTPGHEAFAALREHGAALTDLAIIVVAGDDGVKPQTLEAIRFANNANVKMIFAVNKMDKPESDINRVKQQLAEHNILAEDWGGDAIIMPVSAKTKDGINELIDMVLLLADVEELKADTKLSAQGLVIESHLETGKGSVAICLVEQGILHLNQYIVIGAIYGKIRTLETTNGSAINQAGPSTPVVITGLKGMPAFGDEFYVAESEKEAKRAAEEFKLSSKGKTSQSVSTGSELLSIINRKQTRQELNILIKADVQGSLTSVIDSLKSLEHEEVAVRVVGSGIGAINESDLHMAQTSSAVIYAFHIDIPQNIKQLARRDKITIKKYDVIYELIEDAKARMSDLLAPKIIETDLGRLLVKGIFKTTKNDVICGGEVSKGKISAPALARIERDGENIGEAELIGVKKGSTDVKEILEGEMCGLHLSTSNKLDIQEGDKIEIFTREAVSRTL